jgi:hypothetical protein
MITVNGIFDFENQKVVAPNTTTWGDLTSWADWTNWTLDTDDDLYWLLDPVDLGRVKQFCLTITTEANGTVDYYVYTSTTGVFSGEETEIEIEAGDTAIAAFSTRYYQVGLRVGRLAAPQEITGIEVRLIEGKNKFSIDDVDTSTLSGTVDERDIDLPRPVGTISNIQITPKQVTAYTPDFYVSEITSSSHVTPIVVDKTVPSITLVGIDGYARDAVVDVLIEYLPEMYMDGKNLRVR